MNRRIMLLCILALTPWKGLGAQPGGAELWVARYNGAENSHDEVTSLAVDAQGNAYVTGFSWSDSTSYDYTTVAYNSEGVQQWLASYNGVANSNDKAYSVAADNFGNVYVTGSCGIVGTSCDYVTIKYNAAGMQQWVAFYDGPAGEYDIPSNLAMDAQGNIYVTGRSYDFGGSSDYATIKYDSAGHQVWVARYNGPSNHSDYALDVAVDSQNYVYVTGTSQVPDSAWDIATVKYDSSGNQLWAARYNGTAYGWDGGSKVCTDASGNVYVTGWSSGIGTSFDYVTIKYNALGAQQWVARYNGPGNSEDFSYDIATDLQGNVFVTGTSYGSGTESDYATIKYDANGAQLWVARYNGPGNYLDYATSLGLDAQGNVYVTGSSDSLWTVADYATIEYNSDGVEQWVSRYDGPVGQYDYATSLVLDTQGHVYVSGNSAGHGTDCDFATIKYYCGDPPSWMSPETTILGQPLPQECRLEENFPNPFNACTVLSFELRVPSFVSLKVYDTGGRLVSTLVDGWRSAGMHELTWDASDLPSGIYFARLVVGDYVAVQKLVLLK